MYALAGPQTTNTQNKNAHTPGHKAGSTADDPIGTATDMHEKTTKISNHRAAFLTANVGRHIYVYIYIYVNTYIYIFIYVIYIYIYILIYVYI